MKPLAFVVATFFLSSTFAYSQILNQVGGTVKGHVKDKANEKANEKTDQYNRSRSNKDQLHSTNGESSPSPAASDSTMNGGERESFSLPEGLASSYIMKYHFVAEYTEFYEGSDPSVTLLHHFLGDSVVITQTEEAYSINEFIAQKLITLDNASKTGVVTTQMSMPVIANYASLYGLSKTGKSKTISGFPCSEYKVVQPSGEELILWISDAKIFPDLNYNVQDKYASIPNFGQGDKFAFEIYIYDAQKQLKSSVVFKDFVAAISTFNLAEYQLTAY